MSRLLALGLAVVLLGSGVSAPAAWAPGGKAATKAAKVDLNTATEQELEALPGVGAATAKKIIAGRPYTSVDGLAKAGVSAKTIEKVTPLVTVSGGAPAAQAPPSDKAASKSMATKTAPTEARVAPAKGMVWVNTKSGVFHHEGDRWYGKTKEGKFMTEADALKAGYHASKEGAAKDTAAKK